MIKEIKLHEITDNSLDNYSLCFIDNIDEMIYVYDETPDFFNTHGCHEKQNPEFIKGEQELYAYFTPISLDEQWGDDWNDSPYEHNAGLPYEHGDDYTKVITLIRIPFCVKSNNYTLPYEYGYCNSPFCVDDINHHACAWIYDVNMINNRVYKHVAILAGVSPKEFKDKLEEIHKNNPDWKPLTEDE